MANEGSPVLVLEIEAQALDDEINASFPFGPFAEQPEYVEYNAAFVGRTLETKPGLVVVDIACGTGLVTRLVRDRLHPPRGGDVPAEIIGIDPNQASIKKAENAVATLGKTKVRFQRGTGQELLNFVSPGSVDVVYLCNAIHEIPQQEIELILKAIFVALKPGGKVFINSTFTKEMFPGRESTFKWLNWRKRSLKKFANAEFPDGKDPKKIPFKIYSTEEYCGMLKSAGFEIDKESGISRVTVNMPSRLLRDISQYRRFIEGQFIDGRDMGNLTAIERLTLQRNALIEVIDEMEQELREATRKPDNVLVFPRRWIEIKATRPEEKLAA